MIARTRMRSGIRAPVFAFSCAVPLVAAGSASFQAGVNWYPFLKREVHLNVEGIYLNRSPVGGISYPYIVGGNGWLYNTDFIITF